jgi:hypothetical protein
MASVAKDRRAEERGCDEAEDRSSALVGVWKRGSLGQPSQRPLRPRGVHTQLKRSVTDRAATTMDALVSTMQDVGLTKGNAKYKKEISKTEKRLTGGGSQAQPRPEAEARSSTPCIELRTE